jgi:quercetin dioxygenase-like cupin family protein
MELSERYIKQFESEGFASVYEWQDKPREVYEEHEHESKTSLFVTDGSVTFIIDGVEKMLKVGDRLDIPAKVKHSATVGPQGCIMIVGE